MKSRYRLERAPGTNADLRSILRFLIKSYRQFGETFDGAKMRAAQRLACLEDELESLCAQPHQGTLRPDLMLGLRCVTKDRAIVYFTIDDEARLVRVLAIFFGGQDHQSAMLRRFMQDD